MSMIGFVFVSASSFSRTTLSTVLFQTGEVCLQVLRITQMLLQPNSAHVTVWMCLLEKEARAALNAARGAPLHHVFGAWICHQRVWGRNQTLVAPFAAWICLCSLGWHDGRRKHEAKIWYQAWIGTETGRLKSFERSSNAEIENQPRLCHVIQSWLFNGIMRGRIETNFFR